MSTDRGGFDIPEFLLPDPAFAPEPVDPNKKTRGERIAWALVACISWALTFATMYVMPPLAIVPIIVAFSFTLEAISDRRGVMKK